MPTVYFSAKYPVPTTSVSFSPKLLPPHKSYKHLCIDFPKLQGLLLVGVFSVLLQYGMSELPPSFYL